MLKPQFWIAQRQVFSKNTHTFSRFIQWTAVGAIMLSTAVLWVVLSVFNGFAEELNGAISKMRPHLIVAQGSTEPSAWKDLFKTLEHDPSVLEVTPTLQSYALLLSTRAQPFILRAAEVSTKLLDEERPSWQKENLLPVRVSKPLSEIFGLTIGDTLPLQALSPKYDSVKVRVVVAEIAPKGGTSGLSEMMLWASRAHLFKALALEETQDAQYGVSLRDTSQLEALKELIARNAPTALVLDESYQALGLVESVKLQKRMMFVVLALILCMGMFNLCTSLTMVVRERAKELALFKTIGMEPSTIRQMVLFQGGILTLMGLVIGLLLGFALSLKLTAVVRWVEGVMGFEFASRVFILDYLPTKILWFDAWMITLLTLLVGFLSVWFPASKASKIRPAECLRYE